MTLTPEAVRPDDILPLRAVGVRDRAIVDAIYVCALFNVIDRIADALDFHVPPAAFFAKIAGMMLKEGYKIPFS